MEHHFLNLGAGVQSTALYLMSIDGDEPEVPKFDAAIFADTHAIYESLQTALNGITENSSYGKRE